MARGGGGGKGGKGGGKGKPTQRSQNYLRQYGYPSSKALRREAEGLAGASVPSVRSVERPYNRQAQSAKDFLAAVQAALSQTQSQVGTAYDQATSQQSAMDQATQNRLAGLGLGVDAAGVQAAEGARGDSASANLLSNEASAKAYAAAQPGIAAGNTGVVLAGLRKEQTDALQTRRDQLRQSFFAALQNVQSNALARAGFNQSADQFQRNMALQREQMATQASQFAQSQAASQASSAASLAEQRREFNLSRKDQKQSASAAGITDSEYRQEAQIVADYTGGSQAKTENIPQYGPNGHVIGYKQKTVKGTGTPNIALQGQDFRQVLETLVQQGVHAEVAIPMLERLYTDPILKNAPRGTDQWHAYQSYLKFIDPHYGHHRYEGEHGQQYRG